MVLAQLGDHADQAGKSALLKRVNDDQGHDAVELFGRDGRFVRRVTRKQFLSGVLRSNLVLAAGLAVRKNRNL